MIRRQGSFATARGEHGCPWTVFSRLRRRRTFVHVRCRWLIEIELDNNGRHVITASTITTGVWRETMHE